MDPFSFDVTNLQNVIFFLLPGLITVFLFFYQIPDRKKSDLTTISMAVIFSVVVAYLTSLLFSLINFLSNLKLDLNDKNPAYSWTSLLVAFLLSVVMARFVKSRYFKILSKRLFNVDFFPFGRVWNSFFSAEDKPILKIFLNDGRCYVGALLRYSQDADDDIQELILWKPYYYDKQKGSFTLIKEAETVLIQGNSIVSIEKVLKENATKLYK